MPALKQIVLPDGLRVWAHDLLETQVVYREIVLEKTYERHGISLQPGATIFDVGANIGLFSIHLHRTVPDADLHAFELVPDVCEALRINLQSHAPGAKAYNIGLAEHGGEVDVRFNPFSTITSSIQPDVFTKGASKTASLLQWIRAGLRDMDQLTEKPAWLPLARRGLETPVVRYGVMALLLAFNLAIQIRNRIYTRRRRCVLRSLTEVLKSTSVRFIDLLKIDVEGAEESVIAGIEDSDWLKIRQIVIEVHDLDGRLDRLRQLLESRGFVTTHAREDWALHELLSISTLYARRP